MAYRVVTPVAVEPVTLADARLHLRLSADNTSEDTLITAWISVAREYAEVYTRRALAPQTLEMALDAFPGLPSPGPWDWRGLRLAHEDGSFDLAMPPVASVTSITYTDPNGTPQTLDPAKYALSPYGAGVKVYPTYGNPWPQTQASPDAVKVLYSAGYSTPPAAVRAAILLIVGHLYENRQEVVTDLRQVSIQIPVGAEALLDTIKLWSV